MVCLVASSTGAFSYTVAVLDRLERGGKKRKERNRGGLHKTKRMEMKQHGPCLIVPDIMRPVERRENLYGLSYHTAVCNYVGGWVGNRFSRGGIRIRDVTDLNLGPETDYRDSTASLCIISHYSSIRLSGNAIQHAIVITSSKERNEHSSSLWE